MSDPPLPDIDFDCFTWCIDWTCNCAGDLHTFISHETNVWRSAADISTWLRRGLEWWVRSWSVISAKNAKKYLKILWNFILRILWNFGFLPSSEYSLFHARAASILWTSPENIILRGRSQPIRALAWGTIREIYLPISVVDCWFS